MSKPDKSSCFQTLPYDLIHEICIYLPHRDFQNLKLVCKSVLSALPLSRLNAHQRTIFFVKKEIELLKALGSSSREHRSRIGHIVFDLSSPYVKFIEQFSGFDRGILRYSRVIRSLATSGRWLMNGRRPQWLPFPIYHDEERQVFGFDGKGVKRTVEPTDKIIASLISSINFNDSDSRITEIDHPKLEEFFQTLTETLKTLPNLRTLEIRSNDTETASEIHTFWKKYNPHINTFFQKNPDLESPLSRDLSWQRCIELLKPIKDDRIRFDQAYMGLLNSAAQAQCQISEVRINATNILRCEETVTPNHVRDLLTRSDAEQYANLYKENFANLTHIEFPISLWGCYCGGFRQYSKPSPLFIALLQNVEELTITRLRARYGYNYEWEVQPDLFIPDDLILPKLRTLEIIEVGILYPVLEFFKANKSSLKKLVCTSTFNQRVLRVDMIQLLSIIHNDLDLDYYRIDFLTNKDVRKLCYLCVEVSKIVGEVDSQDEGIRPNRYRYRIGTKCQTESIVGYKYSKIPEGGEPIIWTDKESWEGFTSGIEEIGTSGVCDQHWEGDQKPSSGLLLIY
ncbi:hypothetical protein TWF506_004035 [Arthrobotrys conoides]|uniref:F-box domain-containing protein n=1 Tax=Arthrobotrys conoides TaxID=74498 RepID=A0AAN8NKP3_9PEZI